jgi:hypothetical protein
VTTTAGRTTAASTPTRSAAASPTLPFTERTRAWIGYTLLAALAYVPLLLTQPGKVAADTKTYLYLDPGRLLSRAPSMWDPNIGLGTVTHQTIGYLFPMGPFYWLLETGLGLPSWVAQRLWLGTLLIAAGLGMRFLLKTLGMRGPGVVVGLLAFMLTPYLLDYSARISVILGPWAALPWMVALVVLALRHGGWKYPALFAIVIQLVGGVNATALLFAGIAPALWIPYSIWVTRESTVRRAWTVLWRTALLTLVTSLWWIAGLWAQGGYGLDILKFTETVQSVSKTSFPGEIMRGLGYWFFYGQDKVGPWTESAKDYTQHIWLILVSYLIPTLALLSGAFTKWRYRTYFIITMLVGVAIAVGAEPYNDPTAVGSVFKAFANSSAAGLALRSTGRAVPLVVLGVAALLACGVNALAQWFNGRGLGVYGLVAAGLAVFLLLLNFPALWDGTYYGKNLERPENIPTYWTDAIKYLNAQSHDTRIMELPGADFASYRWGNTVDPITPGLTDRPYVARELIPWGSPPSANLLNAFDRQLQEQLLDPASIAPIAQKMSVGDVTLRMDIQTDRYNLIRPQLLWQMFSPTPPSGLGDAKIFGTKIPGKPKFPQIDEQVLGATQPFPNPPPVAVLPVQNPLPIIRATSTDRPLVVDGDGEGLVDVAATGLVDNGHAVFYSGSFANDPAALRARLGSDATLVVTDTNRKRAVRWSTVRDNYGYTEQAGEKPLVQDPSDARLDVFPGASDDAYTVTQQRGVKSVQASHYGNPVSYTAEDRAERALDGDPFTAWKVGAFANVDGERLQIELDKPITTDHVNLLQPLNGPRDRYITKVTLTFDGKDSVVRTLGPASRSLDGTGENVPFPKRKFSTLDIRIDSTNVGHRFQYGGASAVGFSEVRLRDEKATSDVRVDEVIRMPTDLLAAAGTTSQDHPLVFVMTRDRQYPTPPRYDPELNLTRTFRIPTDRAFAIAGTLRVNSTAPDDVIDDLVGIPGLGQGGIKVLSSEYLDGDARARGSSAFDGDPTTAWSTKFANAADQWVEETSDHPVTFDHMNLQVVADGRHSVPTELEISSDDGTKRVVNLPPITDRATPNAVVPVPVKFAPITGRTIKVTITAIRPVHTLEYFSASQMAMPVAIAEMGIPGVQRAVQPAQLPSVCRTDLLSIDGKPFGVRVTGSTADALAYKPLPLQPCGGNSISMTRGDHLVRSRNGGTTGLDVDQVVLSSDAGGAAVPTAAIVPQADDTASVSASRGASRPTASSGPNLEVVHSGRTSATLHVASATSPFWLVLGQSLNDGWKATANGKDLGAAQLIDGYANGWLVKPAKNGGAITLHLDWTPQKTVWTAIWLSVVGGLVCIGLIVAATVLRRRRRARADAAFDGDGASELAPMPQLSSPLVAFGHDVSTPAVVGTTIVAVLLGSLLIRPWCGIITGGATLLVLLRPRFRAVLSLLPFLFLGLCGLYAAASQYHYHVGPIFEWPTQLWRVRTLGWLAVVLFACDAMVEIVRTHRRARAPAEASG